MTLQLTRAEAAIDWSARRAAQEPPEVRGGGRDDVRLLVTGDGSNEHRHFTEFPDLLRAGDLLVVNTSATRPASLPALGGLRVHISTEAPGGYHVVEVRRAGGPASLPLDAPPPPRLELEAGGRVELLGPFPDGPPGRLWLARIVVDGSLDAYLAAHGDPIRYPYVTEYWPLGAYQTVFATEPGSAEMASAGRAFTPGMLARLAAAGVAVVPIVLHTGVSSLESGEPPYPEWYSVPVATARLVNAARSGDGRVVAVGTTVVRALESTASGDGLSHPGRGWTDLVINARRGLRVVDGLLTGWHEPESSHLAMLEAVAGEEVVATAYAEAIAAGYLWHEFGDLHLMFGSRERVGRWGRELAA